MRNNYIEIESNSELESLLVPGQELRHYAFQNLTFIRKAALCRFVDCLFIGCTLPVEVQKVLGEECYLFPKIPLPFDMFPSYLYSAADLYKGYDYKNPTTFEHCYDSQVYRHYISKGKNATDISETLARSLHDHSVSDALYDMLSQYDERRVVAVMGGHALLRTDAMYRNVVFVGKKLSERGFLMVTGGGPGAMEATHLGAWLAGRPDDDIDSALALLAVAPSYKDKDWLPTAFEVIHKFPRVGDCNSIGIPTWFYGHEPATPFATHIAKYFDNSIREDGLLAIAKGGVIYSPGSAGTMQEIFQDAAQNHYLTCGYASPMVFLGQMYWTDKFPVYPLLKNLSDNGCYCNLMLTLTDDYAEAVGAIERFAADGCGCNNL